jgi:hypothetical protein
MSFVAVATFGVAAVSMLSGAQQANDIRANADLQQSIDDLNAQYADLDAFHARATGQGKEAQYEGQVQQVEGEQTVAMASRGVDVNFGTAAEISGDTKVNAMLNGLDIKSQAEQKAMGYESEARNLRVAGTMGQEVAGAQANATTDSSLISAASSITGYYTKGLPKDKPKDSIGGGPMAGSSYSDGSSIV